MSDFKVDDEEIEIKIDTTTFRYDHLVFISRYQSAAIELKYDSETGRRTTCLNDLKALISCLEEAG